MSVGIAFSGGGISAAISAACAWNSIANSYPSVLSSNNITVSTVSGGSIGYGLWVNANEKIYFPTYEQNVTLEELLEGQIMPKQTGEKSFLHNMYAPEQEANDRWCDSESSTLKISVGEFANRIGRLPFAMFMPRRRKSCDASQQLHWWSSFIAKVFGIVCVNNVRSGDRPWISSFAFLEKDSTTKQRHGKGITKMLHHVLTDLSSGNSVVIKDGHSQIMSSTQSPVLETLSYTSAFWAAPLINAHRIAHHLFSWILLRSHQPTGLLSDEASSRESRPVMLDGGVVDTTGLIGLLHQQTDHIIAFYNNNIPLVLVRSSIAYLFGVNATTDSMNSLLGPSVSQVFPSSLYHEVIANLSDPNNGVVHLRKISVIPNQMGVEPYMIKSLVIFSNAQNNNFILDDTRIATSLSPNWPDNYIFSPPRLDSNLLCMLQDWKVRSHSEVFDPLVSD